MKTIKVQEKSWKKLTIWKVHLGCKNLDEVIERMMKIVQKIENLKEAN